MFMLTAKLDRRKAIIIVALLAVIIAALIILAHIPGGDVSSQETSGSGACLTNSDRVSYLNALGWEVKEKALEEQTVVIPREFGTVYGRYNELQTSQGFDLRDYSGLEAVRYTYEITNYPETATDPGSIVADIIVYRGEVIAGDVQCTELDGFMHGLEYPD